LAEARDANVLAGWGGASRETVEDGFRRSLLFLHRAEAAVLMKAGGLFAGNLRCARFAGGNS
jgi:hypothetical protein